MSLGEHRYPEIVDGVREEVRPAILKVRDDSGNVRSTL